MELLSASEVTVVKTAADIAWYQYINVVFSASSDLNDAMLGRPT